MDPSEKFIDEFKSNAQDIVRKWLPGQSYGYNEVVIELEEILRITIDNIAGVWRVEDDTIKSKRRDMVKILAHYSQRDMDVGFFNQGPHELARKAKALVDEVYKITDQKSKLT